MNQIRIGKKVEYMVTRCSIFMMACLVLALCAQTVAGQESTHDALVQKDLKTAYDIAQSLFTDNPRGRVDLPSLQSYGFRSTEDVSIRILDGSKHGLLISGKHDKSIKVYCVNKAGNVTINEDESNRIRR